MRARTLVALGFLALAGCHSPVTEVVIVIDTDLSTPSEADTLQLQITSATSDTTQTFGGGPFARQQPLPTFPATIGLVPGPGTPVPFSITATLSLTNPEEIVAVRKATDVQFVQGQTRALVLTLLRACACKGTNCPGPSTTPPCGDLVAPTLTPFDPNHIPHLDRTDAGASMDGGDDAARDGAADLSAARDTAADRAAEAGEDAPRDVAGDLAAEVAPDAPPADVAPEAPARFALGHTCSGASQCQDNLCVDGVCCESQCSCGTCGTGGKCDPAGAGTDPRGACGLYTCDGTGACAASCPQEYGSCASACAVGGVCDGVGHCIATTARLGYCVVGTCTCQQGLSCQPQDGGGPGVCL